MQPRVDGLGRKISHFADAPASPSASTSSAGLDRPSRAARSRRLSAGAHRRRSVRTSPGPASSGGPGEAVLGGAVTRSGGGHLGSFARSPRGLVSEHRTDGAQQTVAHGLERLCVTDPSCSQRGVQPAAVARSGGSPANRGAATAGAGPRAQPSPPTAGSGVPEAEGKRHGQLERATPSRFGSRTKDHGAARGGLRLAASGEGCAVK